MELNRGKNAIYASEYLSEGLHIASVKGSIVIQFNGNQSQYWADAINSPDLTPFELCSCVPVFLLRTRICPFKSDLIAQLAERYIHICLPRNVKLVCGKKKFSCSHSVHLLGYCSKNGMTHTDRTHGNDEKNTGHIMTLLSCFALAGAHIAEALGSLSQLQNRDITSFRNDGHNIAFRALSPRTQRAHRSDTSISISATESRARTHTLEMLRKILVTL